MQQSSNKWLDKRYRDTLGFNGKSYSLHKTSTHLITRAIHKNSFDSFSSNKKENHSSLINTDLSSNRGYLIQNLARSKYLILNLARNNHGYLLQNLAWSM